ncbi:65-kDa microtubule-associated protein 8 [Argentina anserina]|uniref:65-kDa microtubule-associated protein 8 n=1 Tax=Argentina anserina TaxID=57926 RepID=UPI0021766CAD|nr:65-kDa microtubule-associated protein 8 [Potentilla anserina]
MGSFQSPVGRSSTLAETSCGYLLQELQLIWNEIGQDKLEREKILVDLEQECLEVYRRKVDAANTTRARLHQELAETEAEFTHLLLSLGERSLPGRPEKMVGTLKEQLDSITPALRDMRLRKEERVNKFRAVQEKIQKISAEIAGQSEYENSSSDVRVNENDLSLKKLEEYQTELQRLHNDRNERLERVEKYIDSIRKLSLILGTDSSMVITKVHPSLNELCGIAKNISNSILAKLDSTVESLEEEKQKRLEKLHHLGKALTNLWNIMDTPYKDRQSFSHVTALLSVSSAEVTGPGSLTQNIIQQVEAEVKRLDQLKISKMKELFLKKQNQLKEICTKSHMEIPMQVNTDNIINLMNSGEVDHADLVMRMDQQISRAVDEACSRKTIMEKVEKWMLARDEERWLEEYGRDENRYSVRRGAHKNLRRAERARVLVSKIPALVDLLIENTKSWEEERKKTFLYDEIPLLAMLEEYNVSRQEKEGEMQRQREVKFQGQIGHYQQEKLYLPNPSSSPRRTSNRSVNGGFTTATPLNRRLSLGLQKLGPNSIDLGTQSISNEANKVQRQKMFARPGLVSPIRDETASVVSTFSSPLSP